MKENGDKVIEWLKDLLYHEDVFREFIRDWKMGYKGKDDIEITGRFLFLSYTSYNSVKRYFRVNYTNNISKTFYRKVEEIYPLIRERLRDVVILNRDFRDVLKSVSKTKRDVLLYIDPPYFGTEDYYDVKFTLEDHRDLADMLHNINAKFILSYYDNEYVRELYPESKFNYLIFDRVKFSSPVRSLGREILITNYPLSP